MLYIYRGSQGIQRHEDALSKAKTIKEIKATKMSGKDFAEYYTIVYDMTHQPALYNYSSPLYEKYCERFEAYVHTYMMPGLEEWKIQFLNRLQDQEIDLDLIEMHQAIWLKYYSIASRVSNIFVPIGSFFCRDNNVPYPHEVVFRVVENLAMSSIKILLQYFGNHRERYLTMIIFGAKSMEEVIDYMKQFSYLDRYLSTATTVEALIRKEIGLNCTGSPTFAKIGNLAFRSNQFGHFVSEYLPT